MTSKDFANATDANRQQGGRRNLIINGAMQVWQRGTSHANTTSIAYYADRWKHQNRQSSQTDIDLVENQDIGDGVMNVYKITVDTPPTDAFLLVNQFIENGSFTVLDKDITISWYARQSTGSGVTTSANVEVDGGLDYVGTGSDNSLTSSWQRFTQTFSVSGYTASDVSDASLRMQIFFKSLSSSDVVEFTGVQLEVGDTATPFEHRSYGEELALCQRYYYQISSESAGGGFGNLNFHRYADSVNTYVAIETHPVPMRSSPTITFESGIRVHLPSLTVENGTFTAFMPTNARFNIGVTPASSNNSAIKVAYPDGDGVSEKRIFFNAEL